MITEGDAHRAHDWLHDNAAEIARLYGNKVFEEEKLKIVLATLADSSEAKSSDAKKWDAMSDPRYVAQLERVRKACEAEKEMTLKARAQETTIALFQTQSANQRGRI